MYIRKPLKIGLVAPGQFSGPRLESGPSLSLNHLPTASGWAKKSLTLSGGVNPIRHQSTEAIPGPPLTGVCIYLGTPELNARSYSRADLLRYKIAPKYPLSGPFHHSSVGRNPEVAGRFVAIISFYIPLSAAHPPKKGSSRQWTGTPFQHPPPRTPEHARQYPGNSQTPWTLSRSDKSHLPSARRTDKTAGVGDRLDHTIMPEQKLQRVKKCKKMNRLLQSTVSTAPSEASTITRKA